MEAAGTNQSLPALPSILRRPRQKMQLSALEVQLNISDALIVDKAGYRTILAPMPVDPNLLKVARLLVDLSVDEVAKRANVSRRSLASLEAGTTDCMLSTIELVKQALEAEGVVFLGETEAHGPGVRVSMATAADWSRKRGGFARGPKDEEE